MTTFYKNYIALCAQKQKSASAVAVEVGLSRTSPNGWKKGKKPSDINLKKLATYFGVTVEDLVLEQKEKPTTQNGGELRKLTPDNYKEAYKEMTVAELYAMMADITKELQKRGSDETQS